jgi:membrane protein required for beta-lactamase induction
MRRLFAIIWLASTACVTGSIITFGFAGEAVLWSSLDTWLAIAFGFALAAIATVLPAALMAATLYAISIKRALPRHTPGTAK